MTWQTMWTFHTKNFSISWQIAPDDDCDTSFDETGETAEKVASGAWQCFISRIIVYCDGNEFGCAHLGGSIYENPAEFRDHIGARGKWGSYFADMVREAIREARRNISHTQKIYIRECEAA